MSQAVATSTTSAGDALRAKLDDPAVAASLARVLDHADLLALMVDSLDGLLQRSEIIGNALADSLGDFKLIEQSEDNPLKGIDLKELAGSLTAIAKASPRVTPAITKVVDSGLIDAVMDSGITEPAVIDQVGRLGRGLAKGAEMAESNPIHVGGPLALLKQLKDPDIARGMSFFLNVLKSMGAELGRR